MASTIALDLVGEVFTLQNAARLVGAWGVYQVGRALYNISPFHPLSGFPGPKLASMTILYEFWFDMVLVGRYSKEIKKLHDVYGPIVRISPDELHCNDSSFIDEIYASGARPRNKQQHFLNSLAGPPTVSAFGTLDHDLHRTRRAAMNKFFSRAQMLRLEPQIHTYVQMLADKLLLCFYEKFILYMFNIILQQDRNMVRNAVLAAFQTNFLKGNPTKQPFNVTMAYSCFTTDSISDYCFGEPLGFLAQESWEPNFREAMNGFTQVSFAFRYFPWIRVMADLAPKFTKYMDGDIGMFMNEMYVNMPARIRKARADHSSGKHHDQNSVFMDLLDSSLSNEEKSDFRLSGEGFSLIGAGTETTAWTLSVITYYLLTQPAALDRLRDELKEFNAKELSWAALEKLPFLTAVIKEGLRLSYGESARSPRVPRDEDLIYRSAKFEYVIPKGTAIGVTPVLIHHNEDIFPDSESFVAERWLSEDAEQKRSMNTALISFSRGSRQCLGMNLAYCELYLATAVLALRVFPQMKLFETTLDDVKYDHDLVVAQAKAGSKGIRVDMF